MDVRVVDGRCKLVAMNRKLLNISCRSRQFRPRHAEIRAVELAKLSHDQGPLPQVKQPATPTRADRPPSVPPLPPFSHPFPSSSNPNVNPNMSKKQDQASSTSSYPNLTTLATEPKPLDTGSSAPLPSSSSLIRGPAPFTPPLWKSPRSIPLHALKGGLRAFLIAYGMRGGVAFMIRLIRVVRKRCVHCAGGFWLWRESAYF